MLLLLLLGRDVSATLADSVAAARFAAAAVGAAAAGSVAAAAFAATAAAAAVSCVVDELYGWPLPAAAAPVWRTNVKAGGTVSSNAVVVAAHPKALPWPQRPVVLARHLCVGWLRQDTVAVQQEWAS